MALVTENYHQKKLKEYGINIKTKYIVGNKILERNSDNSINDDISKGVRCEKQYFLGNELIHSEKLFDSRIEYTFISQEEENKDYTCPNCGMTSKVKDFIDGCPYCKTYYNIDYTDKDLGSKYHYDRVLKSNTYRIITLIIDLIISVILSFIFIKVTSRTFNNYDIYKIFIYSGILALVLYYFFYTIDAYVILGPIKKYKDRQNQKQMVFWERIRIDKKNFFNNLNYEVGKYYYNKNNIIDYDILDYTEFREFKESDTFFVEVKADVRVVYFIKGKISSKIIKEVYRMKQLYDKNIQLNGGPNIIKCSNCGASIDVTAGVCEYCHSEVKGFQEWVFVEK